MTCEGGFVARARWSVIVTGAAVSVSVQGSELQIVGSADNDEVGVGFDAASGKFRARATDIAAGAGCVVDIPPIVVNAVAYPAGATCTISGVVTAIRADLGDGNDLLNSGVSFPDVGDDFTVPMIVDGGAGNDRLVTSSGNDVIDGGAGDDTPDGSLGDDQITGGAGDDQIYDNLGNDVISGGGDPRDFIYAFRIADGADRWSNGIASYQRRINSLSLSLDGGANDGEFGEGDNLGAGIHRVIGGDGNDAIVGSSGADILEGWLGNNRLDGRAGADILIGDRNRGFVKMPPPGLVPPIGVALGTQANLLIGGPGADRLFGDVGPDRLLGGSGADGSPVAAVPTYSSVVVARIGSLAGTRRISCSGAMASSTASRAGRAATGSAPPIVDGGPTDSISAGRPGTDARSGRTVCGSDDARRP